MVLKRPHQTATLALATLFGGAAALMSAGTTPASALPPSIVGAAAKADTFAIRPPWQPGATERITCGYSCGGHQGLSNLFASNDHYAIDFGLFRGEEIRAVASGKVVWAAAYSPPSSWSCYGNSVAINHDGPGAGYTSMYAHMDSLTVKAGAAVNAGDVIGYAGGSGGGTNSACPYPFAPHLHFVMYRGAVTGNHPPYGGTAVAPEPFVDCHKADGAACDLLDGGDVLTAVADAPATVAETVVPAAPHGLMESAPPVANIAPAGQPAQAEGTITEPVAAWPHAAPPSE